MELFVYISIEFISYLLHNIDVKLLEVIEYNGAIYPEIESK